MSNIIQIGDFSIELARRSYEEKQKFCDHMSVSLEEGDIVLCKKCNMQVSAFWCLRQYAIHWQVKDNAIKMMDNDLKRRLESNLHLIAAKKIERVWRGKKMAPCCPHCKRGILASDNLGGHQINKKIELNMREKEKELLK